MRNKNLLKQKLWGLVLAGVGLLSIPLLEMDGTIAIVAVPVGLWLLFTRKDLYEDEYSYEEDYEEDERL